MQDVYIIGAHEADGKRELKNVIRHEFSHAMFYLSKEYRASCNHILKTTNKEIVEAKKKLLLSMGYCKEVLNDEMQAYWATEGYGEVSAFKENFDKYIKQIKWKI